MDVPYAWALVPMAGAFMFGTAANGARFVTSGGKPAYATRMMFFGLLALMSLFVAWIAFTGPPFP